MADIYPGLQRTGLTLEAMRELQMDAKADKLAKQVSSRETLRGIMVETTYHLTPKIKKKHKAIKTQKTRIQKLTKAREKMERIVPVDQLKDSAFHFQEQNQELEAKILLDIRAAIKPDDTKEQILQKIRNYYPDVSLASDVIDYLLETTDGVLHQRILELKNEFNEEFEREITGGKNITEQARAAAEKGLGTPTSLRDHYRDLTGNPREPNALFTELSQQYEFKDLKKVVDFFLHSLGSDLKSKGPSIPRGELHRLLSETRTLQSILGIYRFFKGRMRLMHSLFKKEGIDYPDHLTFELMAKQFMNLVSERYPTGHKILQSTTRLGLEKWIIAKIIALSQFRDAIREVSLEKVYKSLKHRDEFYQAVIEALEDLEDELEEQLSKEEEEEEEDNSEEGGK